MRINSYLTFNGNCREAMQFYQDCLGGELSFQTIGESPLSGKMPGKMKNCILHSTLIKNDWVLMASDMVSSGGLTKGNNVSLSLYCGSEDELTSCYTMLSTGGTTNHPLEAGFWGTLSGDLTDRFGINWILTYCAI